jgi:hypothetical protein
MEYQDFIRKLKVRAEEDEINALLKGVSEDAPYYLLTSGESNATDGGSYGFNVEIERRDGAVSSQVTVTITEFINSRKNGTQRNPLSSALFNEDGALIWGDLQEIQESIDTISVVEFRLAGSRLTVDVLPVGSV